MTMEWWEKLLAETIDRYPGDLDGGMEACEQLLSIPGLPEDLRNGATIETWVRRNQTWYARKLATKGTITAIDFPHQEGWSLFNPSIAVNDDGDLCAIVRSSNYRIDELGRYVIPPEDDGVIKTKNYFLDLIRMPGGEKDFLWDAPDLIDDGRVINWDQPYPVWGMEDCRLYAGPTGWGCLATMRDADARGICVIVDVLLERTMSGVAAIDSGPSLSPLHRHEKNWMPVNEGHITIIDKCYPLMWRNHAGEGMYWRDSPYITRSFRGGAAIGMWEGRREDRAYLCVVHEPITMDPYQKIYTHRFMLIDWESKQITLVSDPFVFEGWGIEFAAGMCQLGDDLVISYGVRDAEARLLRIPLADAMGMLREPLPEEMP
jgi:hypothetical protein